MIVFLNVKTAIVPQIDAVRDRIVSVERVRTINGASSRPRSR